MAVDQREALIAAVRAQVEKERAEKQKKLEREQEAMAFSKKAGDKKKGDEKKQYKTLTAEELARIEEKKRRKRAEELGIDLDAEKKDGLGDGLKTEGEGGLGSTPSGGLGLDLGSDGKGKVTEQSLEDEIKKAKNFIANF